MVLRKSILKIGESACTLEELKQWKEWEVFFKEEDRQQKDIDIFLKEEGKGQLDISWLYFFQEVIDDFKEAKKTQVEDILQGIEVAYGELLEYFVEPCYKHLKENKLLSANAMKIIMVSIFQLLGNICFRVFHRELSYYKVLELTVVDSKVAYDKFIKQLRLDIEERVFIQYSYLARLMCNISLSLEKNFTEFLSRVEKDFPLHRHLGYKVCDEEIFIKDIKLFQSDLHRGFQAVIIFTLNNDISYVYKPRNLDIEDRFYKFLKLLNEKTKYDFFKLPKVWAKDGYGYMEYVEFKEVNNIGEVKNYFYRAGAMLYVADFLRATDLHFENVIANGEYPVIVDAETLFHPVVFNERQHGNGEGLSGGVLMSVNKKGKEFESSSILLQRTGLIGKGFSAFEKCDIISSEVTVVYGGKQYKKDIQVRKEEPLLMPKYNLPMFNNKRYGYTEFYEDFESGFDYMKAFFQDSIAELSSCCEYIELQKCDFRVILRATSVYSNIILRSLFPEYLQQGIKREEFFRYISSLSNKTALNSRFERLLRMEEKSLLDINVPYFTQKEY